MFSIIVLLYYHLAKLNCSSLEYPQPGVPFLSLLANSYSSFKNHLQYSLLQEVFVNHASRDSPKPSI